MKGACPKCGELGTIRIRRIGNNEYVYIVHTEGGRRVEHYIAPLERYIAHKKLGATIKSPYQGFRGLLETIEDLVEKAIEAAKESKTRQQDLQTLIALLQSSIEKAKKAIEEPQEGGEEE